MVNDVPELIDSTPLIGDPEAIRERFGRDGYVFFRGVLDKELLRRAYELFKGPLVAEGLIATDAQTTLWTGEAAKTRRPCDALGKAIWPEIAAQPKLNQLMSDVLGETAVWLPIVAHRSSLPGNPFPPEEGIFGARHQDGFFNEGIESLTAWIPLMDIDRANGGLAVSEGSHKGGYLHDKSDGPRYSIPIGVIPDDTWRTADFRVGDVLMFDYRTAHSGMPNHTDLIRLSIDMRVIAQSAPRPVVGTVVRAGEADVLIRTDDGEEVDVTVDDDTYIRQMSPFPKLAVSELSKVATVGGNVIAMVDDRGHATVLRPNFY